MKKQSAKFRVNGGIHPTYNKQLTAEKAIVEMPVPSLLRVSMLQHLGAPAKVQVAKGDTVSRGQLIGEHGGFISVRVHAPTSGTVKAVAEAPTATGGSAIAVDIEPDGEDRWVEDITPHPDWESLDGKKLISLVSDAGIAGMGGAGFPTHVKLSPPPGKVIDTLIINGAECEPYLTADHRLMVERAEDIWHGIRIIRKILGCATVRVAIEDNKPDAIATMEAAMAEDQGDSAVVVLKTEYPQGAEKQQIFAALGKEIPSGGLPMDVGALVENVGTTLAVYEAVVNGLPLTERVTTVTGYPVKAPGNISTRLGTSYSDLLAFCEGLQSKAAKVISGGPMMGFAQHSLDATTTKTTSGLVFLRPDQVRTFSSMPCISCGRCVQACPMTLMPAELSQMIEAEDIEAAEELNILDCIECGCCAFECPAHRPLVQHMKQAKACIMAKRREEKAKQKS
jgi:electron transport complex protein RnfC